MNDTARPPVLPTAVAALALASVFWLMLVSAGFGLKARSDHQKESRVAGYYPSGHAPQQQVEPLDVVILLALVGSIFLSLSLTVAAFCFWPWHILAGKVLTVAAAVLFLPFLCCGAMLGLA